MRCVFLILLCLLSGLCPAQRSEPCDWLELRIGGGMVLNKTFNNVPYHNDDESHFTYTGYSALSNKYVQGGQFGLSAVLGENKVVKPVISFGYISCNHEYQYEHSDFTPVDNYIKASNETNISYRVTDHYLTWCSALAFYFSRHLSAEPGLMVADNFLSVGRRSGYDSHTETAQPVLNPATNTYSATNTVTGNNYQNSPVKMHPGLLSLSVFFRLNYDFKIKDFQMGCYASTSAGATRRQTWYSVGLYIYPFKKFGWLKDPSPVKSKLHQD